MVDKATSLPIRLFACAILVLLALALVCCIAPGRCDEDEDEEPTVWEKTLVTLNEVGDAQVETSIKYPEDVYSQLKGIVNEYPNFLTRRYLSNDRMKEVENLKKKMEDSQCKVVLTYDSPGYAYNQGDCWQVSAGGEESKKLSAKEYEFKSVRSRHNDSTLFTRQVVETVKRVRLPAGAKGVKCDSGKGSISYRLPGWKLKVGFFSEHKTTLSLVFGILSGFLVLLFIFALAWLFRSRRPIVAVVGKDTLDAPETAGKEKGVCPACGGEIRPGKQFCPRCGKLI